MAWDDGSLRFGMGQECPEHSDEKMRECRMCGRDSYLGCFPVTTVCPTCAEEAEQEELPENADLMKEIGELSGEDELNEDLDNVDKMGTEGEFNDTEFDDGDE